MRNIRPLRRIVGTKLLRTKYCKFRLERFKNTAKAKVVNSNKNTRIKTDRKRVNLFKSIVELD